MTDDAGGAPVVAIVGRANVGKSTLVNRFVGRRVAIEHPEPGVTRDRLGYAVEWNGARFVIVDTGGWEPRAKGLSAKVVAQAEQAARSADVVVFLGDAMTGVTADDLAVARSLRRADIPTVVAVNKVDNTNQEAEVYRFERLGLGPPLPVSALHGRASGDLLDEIVERLRDLPPGDETGADEPRVAIVGRPNAGKSSMFNRLVGEERTIVDEAPGTTRDAIDVVAEVAGHRYRFVDTAGMRRKARTASGPEYYGLVRSLRAIDECDVAVLVVDAAAGPSEQDQKIAQRIASGGRAAVITLNKWDLLDVDDRKRVERDVKDRLLFISWAPIVRTSAKTARGIARLMPAVDRALASWNRRIPTADLNSWLRDATAGVPLHRARGADVRIKYGTQARTRPPQVVLFTSGPVSDQARRAIERRLRTRFDFTGSPIKVIVRAREPRRGATDRRRSG